MYVKGSIQEKTINRLVPLEVNRRHRGEDEEVEAPFEHSWSEVDTKQQILERTQSPDETHNEGEVLPSAEPSETPVLSPEIGKGARQKPQRKAALKALDKFKEWGEQGHIE